MLNLLTRTLRHMIPGVRFSKLPKTHSRKAILCADFLPTEIHFSFVLKAKRINLRSTGNFALVFGLKTSNNNLKKLNFQNRKNNRHEIKTNRLFTCGKNIRPFRVHSTAELKDFAQFHGGGVNLIYVSPTFLGFLACVTHLMWQHFTSGMEPLVLDCR